MSEIVSYPLWMEKIVDSKRTVMYFGVKKLSDGTFEKKPLSKQEVQKLVKRGTRIFKRSRRDAHKPHNTQRKFRYGG